MQELNNYDIYIIKDALNNKIYQLKKEAEAINGDIFKVNNIIFINSKIQELNNIIKKISK